MSLASTDWIPRISQLKVEQPKTSPDDAECRRRSKCILYKNFQHKANKRKTHSPTI